jgi:hypothetical protein
MKERPAKATVFEETYRDYLQQLAATDVLARADRLGATTDGDELIIEFSGSPQSTTWTWNPWPSSARIWPAT